MAVLTISPNSRTMGRNAKALDLPIVESCKRIRIQTKNAILGNQADILAARSELSHLCAEEEQVESAWKVFYTDASDLIEHRLRRDVSKLLRLLTSEGVRLSENKSTAPTLLLRKLTNWTSETNKHFFRRRCKETITDR